jgi:hypothetical protein
MKTTLPSLKALLIENVCEVVFVRRRPKANKPPLRRMLCTLDERILNSTNGRLSLNYKPTSGLMPYNAESKNLLPVWDIFMQDWRMVSMDNCDLVTTIKEEDFWKYFNDTLLPMSPAQKSAYMDS